MPYLITGASGFLARHLLDSLGPMEGDERPWALVRRSGSAPPPMREIVAPAHAWYEAAAPVSIGNVDGIFHLAAEVLHSRVNTHEMAHFNVASTLSMVRLAARHRCRMVFVSTSGVVGASVDPAAAPREESQPSAVSMRWPYYRSKADAEAQALALAQELSVELVILRPPVLLGPNDPKLRATGLVRKFLQGKLPFALSGGMHFVDVRDVSEALVAAMNHHRPAPIYHLPGSAMPLVSFFRELRQAADGRPTMPRVLPRRLALGLARADSTLWTSLMGRSHGWLPDPVVVEMGTYYWGLGGTWARADLNFLARPKEQTLGDTVRYLYEAGLA